MIIQKAASSEANLGTDMMISRDFVKDGVADFLKVSARDIPDDIALSRLIADSFMVVELMIELQETNGIRLGQEDIKHVKSVGELITAIVTAAARSDAVGASARDVALTTKGASNV